MNERRAAAVFAEEMKTRDAACVWWQPTQVGLCRGGASGARAFAKRAERSDGRRSFHAWSILLHARDRAAETETICSARGGSVNELASIRRCALIHAKSTSGSASRAACVEEARARGQSLRLSGNDRKRTHDVVGAVVRVPAKRGHVRGLVVDLDLDGGSRSANRAGRSSFVARSHRLATEAQSGSPDRAAAGCVRSPSSVACRRAPRIRQREAIDEPRLTAARGVEAAPIDPVDDRELRRSLA